MHFPKVFSPSRILLTGSSWALPLWLFSMTTEPVRISFRQPFAGCRVPWSKSGYLEHIRLVRPGSRDLCSGPSGSVRFAGLNGSAGNPD